MNPPSARIGPRTAARVAWSLWAATLALVAGAHALALSGHPESPLYRYWVEGTLIGPTFATLGALIVSRRPGNIIGWLFLVPSVALGTQFLSGQYATSALSGSMELPGGAYAAWLSTMMQSLGVFTVLFLIMLFPTGTLPSPRWRMMAWTTGLVLAVSLISLALMPGPVQDFPSARNPFGVEPAVQAMNLLQTIGGWAGLVCVVAVIFSLILRFYRSRGEERLQLKWFAYAATLGVMAILLGDTIAPVNSDDWFGTLVWTIAPLGLPVSAGIAVLKYRLYDIDLVINRTLVYGLLTLSLALVYFGSVVALQYAFRGLTGEGSQLTVVISTLAIAALFSPLRRRIQSFIDRRFYRKKYDARKMLSDFSATLRDETDLDGLTEGLLGVVRETMQPASVSLWVREDGGKRGAES